MSNKKRAPKLFMFPHVEAAIKVDAEKGQVSFKPWTTHVEAQQKRAALILPRMGPDHWEALERVFQTGKVPIMGVDAGLDLVEWGAMRLITKDGVFAQLTDAGLIVLESKEW